MRQHIDRFTGDMVLHCHVLEHEDIGMMTIINITGAEGTTAYRDNFTANCGACYPGNRRPVFALNKNAGGRRVSIHAAGLRQNYSKLYLWSSSSSRC